jgi:hypothetical protein
MTAPLQVRTADTGLLPFRAQVVIRASGFPRRHLFAGSLKAVRRRVKRAAALSMAAIHTMLTVAVKLASGR